MRFFSFVAVVDEGCWVSAGFSGAIISVTFWRKSDFTISFTTFVSGKNDLLSESLLVELGGAGNSVRELALLLLPPPPEDPPADVPEAVVVPDGETVVRATGAVTFVPLIGVLVETVKVLFTLTFVVVVMFAVTFVMFVPSTPPTETVTVGTFE